MIQFSFSLAQVPRKEQHTLALHGTHASILEEQPVVRFVVLAGSMRIRDLVFSIVAFDKVLHDGTGFEEADTIAIAEGIGQGGNAAIGVDGKEPGFFLRVLADVNLFSLVGKAYWRSAGGSKTGKLAEDSVPKFF